MENISFVYKIKTIEIAKLKMLKFSLELMMITLLITILLSHYLMIKLLIKEKSKIFKSM
jgi:hypothetical protein